MNPLDALSALGQMKMPATTALTPPTAAGPNFGTTPISEGFQNFLPTQSTQATQPTAALNSIPDISISGAGGAGPSTWGHMVQQMVMDVNNKQATAAAKVSDVLQGGPTPVHDAMVSSEEASLSFEFLGEMRNKIVDAYQQVMQMQV
jgi:flagellar hook-basal body complex protein FliE